MFFTRSKSTLAILAMSAAISACGGGGGGTSSGEAVTSSGVITQFGSVYVNGVRYDTSSAQIVSADDDSVIIINPSDAELRLYLGLGQVVTVLGSANDDGSNGVANSVYVDNQLIGPIDAGSVSQAEGTFIVLGQTVSVTPDTIIDDSIIEAVLGNDTLADDVRFADIESVTGQPLGLDQLLAGGMMVEVSGFPTLDGIEATRIEDVDNRDRSAGSSSSRAGEVEVKGFVRNLAAGQFEINDLTVFYEDTDLDPEDFVGFGLAEGDFVEVEGDLLSAVSIDAREIELEDDLPGASSSSSGGASSSSSAGASSSSSAGASSSSSAGGRIEIEGVITEVRPDDATNTSGVVVINGLEIRVDDVSPFSVGQRVRLKGRLQGGVLALEQVRSGNEDSVRTEDQAVSIDSNGVTTRLGITIDFSDRTRLDDVGAGNWIEARGFPLNGDVLWTRVEFDDDTDSDCRLRGPVESITGTDASDFGFVIQNVQIDVSQISSFGNFEDSNDLGIGRQAFFDRLEVGKVVQAKSTSNGCSLGNLVAREVGFESSSNFSSDDDDAGSSSSSSAGGSSSSSAGSEFSGSVASVSGDSFVVNGETISVTAATLIDDSIIEAARGGELPNDLAYGDLPETLAELLPVGLVVEVGVDRSSGSAVATRIEDL